MIVLSSISHGCVLYICFVARGGSRWWRQSETSVFCMKNFRNALPPLSFLLLSSADLYRSTMSSQRKQKLYTNQKVLAHPEFSKRSLYMHCKEVKIEQVIMTTLLSKIKRRKLETTGSVLISSLLVTKFGNYRRYSKIIEKQVNLNVSKPLRISSKRTGESIKVQGLRKPKSIFYKERVRTIWKPLDAGHAFYIVLSDPNDLYTF